MATACRLASLSLARRRSPRHEELRGQSAEGSRWGGRQKLRLMLQQANIQNPDTQTDVQSEPTVNIQDLELMNRHIQ